MSTDEYEKYKDKIPYTDCWWWLRSHGNYQNSAAYVFYDGWVGFSGRGVSDYNGYICPALKISNIKSPYLRFVNLPYDDILVYCGITWLKIDEDLYIAEMPIACRRFDEKSNDYETSEIRQFLLDWHEERKKW